MWKQATRDDYVDWIQRLPKEPKRRQAVLNAIRSRLEYDFPGVENYDLNNTYKYALDRIEEGHHPEAVFRYHRLIDNRALSEEGKKTANDYVTEELRKNAQGMFMLGGKELAKDKAGKLLHHALEKSEGTKSTAVKAARGAGQGAYALKRLFTPSSIFEGGLRGTVALNDLQKLAGLELESLRRSGKAMADVDVPDITPFDVLPNGQRPPGINEYEKRLAWQAKGQLGREDIDIGRVRREISMARRNKLSGEKAMQRAIENLSRTPLPDGTVRLNKPGQTSQISMPLPPARVSPVEKALGRTQAHPDDGRLYSNPGNFPSVVAKPGGGRPQAPALQFPPPPRNPMPPAPARDPMNMGTLGGSPNAGVLNGGGGFQQFRSPAFQPRRQPAPDPIPLGGAVQLRPGAGPKVPAMPRPNVLAPQPHDDGMIKDWSAVSKPNTGGHGQNLLALSAAQGQGGLDPMDIGGAFMNVMQNPRDPMNWAHAGAGLIDKAFGGDSLVGRTAGVVDSFVNADGPADYLKGAWDLFRPDGGLFSSMMGNFSSGNGLFGLGIGGILHEGGPVSDRDPATQDPALPVIVQEGEFVLSPPAAQALGPDLARGLNRLAAEDTKGAACLRARLEAVLDGRVSAGNAAGGVVSDGNPATHVDNLPGRLPEGAFVLTRKAVQALGPKLLSRLDGAMRSGNRAVLDQVRKLLAEAAGGKTVSDHSALRDLLRDPCYSDANHPGHKAYFDFVTREFEKAYPG